jgi:hypothetical protein
MQIEEHIDKTQDNITNIYVYRDHRWGGALLAFGSFLFAIAIPLFLNIIGEWDTSVGDTLNNTVNLFQVKWKYVSLIWTGELIGSILLAVAGLQLHKRHYSTGRFVPASVLWAVLCVGSLLVAIGYALAIGSYPSALEAFVKVPDLFVVIRSGMLALHAVGSIIQLIAILVLLIVEFRLNENSIANRLIQAGMGFALIGIILSFTGLIDANYFAAGIFLGAALLGVAIWIKPKE